jgi:hypothetical protein
MLSGAQDAKGAQGAEGGWLNMIKPFIPKNVSVTVVNQAPMNFNFTIDGIKLPAFSWGWFGVNIGIGVLQGLGGALFNVFLSGLFGGRSSDELLRAFIEAVARVVEQKLKEDDLRKCQALLVSINRNMLEFMNAPKFRDRLDNASNDSQGLLARLESLEYMGYRTYMSAAGMRLAILQERAKLDPAEKENFRNARKTYIEYHDRMDAKIRNECTVDGQMQLVERRIARLEEENKIQLPEITKRVLRENPSIKESVYGEPVDGPVKEVNWKAIQDKVRGDSTVVGQKIVEQWKSFKI